MIATGIGTKEETEIANVSGIGTARSETDMKGTEIAKGCATETETGGAKKKPKNGLERLPEGPGLLRDRRRLLARRPGGVGRETDPSPKSARHVEPRKITCAKKKKKKRRSRGKRPRNGHEKKKSPTR